MVAAKKPASVRDPFPESPESRIAGRSDQTGGLWTKNQSRPSVVPIGNLDAWIQTQRIRQFERQFACQSTRGCDEEGRRSENGARCRSLVEDQAQRLIELTNEIFPPGPLDVRLEFDPDEPDHEYLVFVVTAAHQTNNTFDREFRWHREAARIVDDEATWLRLCVLPQ
jgi:hypothetical protein